MLTQIDVVYENELGEQALALPILGLTPTDGLLLSSVTGLNPPDRDLFIGDYSRDGGIYQGGRVGVRNVVMTIFLNPDPFFQQTYSSLRSLLYKIFMEPLPDAEHVELILHDDEMPLRNLYGYTEKFEGELFSVETISQVSMLCTDPLIRDVEETVLTAEQTLWSTVPFSYTGSASTGFDVEIHVLSDTSFIRLTNNGRSMHVTHPFLKGDILLMNTRQGERAVTLMRSGVARPLLAQLSAESKWLEIHSARNTMVVTGQNSTDVGVKTLKYRASYWGA